MPPNFSAERDSLRDILERESKYWDLTGHLPLWDGPDDLRCFNPICESTNIQYRHWRFFRRAQRTGSDHPLRCDVAFKCRDCSFTLPFAGIVIPERMWEWNESLDRGTGSNKWYWREGRDHIKGCDACELNK